MHVHWSVDAPQGAVSIWYDGAQVVKENKAKPKADGSALFHQTGFHRRSPQPFTETIFLDNFVEADALADVLGMPAPGGDDGGAAPADGGPGDAGTVDGGGSGGGAGGTGGSAWNRGRAPGGRGG